MNRPLAIAAAAFLASLPSQAYYHYVHYAGRTAPFTPIYEKFDLNALPYQTVTFSVSDQSPAAYGPNDSFGSVLSQVKQAVATWNAVPSSALRIAFGGLENQNQLASNTPGGDVIFIDLPPGVIGLGTPTTSTQISSGGFFPIQRSTVMLSSNTSLGPGPSYLEAFFTTTVHEIGHALGLQHTWTGSAMSQAVVRNTSRTRPLDADDIAGLSVLYGKPGWAAGYGSLSGRVTYSNGQPVALASVVAIAPAGSAVSSLTNPDGTYQINGLPPNQNYLVYVHPLPPDAIVTTGEGLKLPMDQNLQPINASSNAFQTAFFGAALTTNPQSAISIPASAGSAITGVNFSVPQRTAVSTYDVVTYYLLDTAARKYVSASSPTTQTGYPAFIDTTQNEGLVIAQAAAPAVLPNPQSMTILGGFQTAPFNLPTYPTVWPYSPGVVDAYFAIPPGAGTGPRHLVFNFGNDMYVLPNGVVLVQKGPPVINSLANNPDGSLTVTGAGLGPDSSVYFDGMKANVTVPFSGTDAQGAITVMPPQGAPGQVSTITVYNTDSQNSMILQSQNPQTYTYPSAPAGQISNIDTTSLPANSSSAINITTTNTNFVDGQVTVGFGSDDVTVRRVWVLSPTHLVANVVVAPNAAIAATEISVISGFQVIEQPGAFQTLPARVGFPSIGLPAVNADPTQQTIYPGSIATIYGQNLALLPASVQVTLNNVPVQLQFVGPNQINFVIPAGFPTGLATLNVNNGAFSAFPVMVEIDGPPPAIASINNAANQPLSASVGPGDVLNLLVTGLDPGVIANPSRVQVTVSGLNVPVEQISQASGSQIQIQIVITQSFGGAQVPVVVWQDGSPSQAATITVR